MILKIALLLFFRLVNMSIPSIPWVFFQFQKIRTINETRKRFLISRRKPSFSQLHLSQHRRKCYSAPFLIFSSLFPDRKLHWRYFGWVILENEFKRSSSADGEANYCWFFSWNRREKGGGVYTDAVLRLLFCCWKCGRWSTLLRCFFSELELRSWTSNCVSLW